MAPHAAAGDGAAASSSVSANNALFLIGFGMFLTVAVLPALLAAVVKLLALLVMLVLLAAATNPSDHSFAAWVSSQENIRLKENPSVSQWFSAVVKTAMSIVRNESLVWQSYNVIVFTVVHVEAVNRYAFGCFGSWRWADSNGYLSDLCTAPWIVRFSRGGVASSIERYVDGGSHPHIAPRSINGSPTAARRRHHHGSTAPSSVPSALADVLDATGLRGVVNSARAPTPLDRSDRELRAQAIQFKIRKEWKDAAQYFLDAAAAALSTLSKTSYRLEAAWCILEDSDTYPNKKHQLIKLVEDVCEELSSSGFFDEASRAIAELALRLKRKFPNDCQREAFAKDIALLFVRAKNIAEAGGNTRSAVENGLRAAAVYVEAGLWALAEECFETAGDLQCANGNAILANEAFGNAVLCRIGQLDLVGAEEMMIKHAGLLDDSSGNPSDMDVLLASVLKAYGKWSPQILETACKRYDSTRRLAPWQRRCLDNLRDSMINSDLR
uniref:Uncharacterized protein n=1 Tax=Globisporangium ultimum (strain ATCC 200006 / CBS 805.95 / DAOM BR144) TaxID=431595 RepID=K3WUR3_GLOUD